MYCAFSTAIGRAPLTYEQQATYTQTGWGHDDPFVSLLCYPLLALTRDTHTHLCAASAAHTYIHMTHRAELHSFAVGDTDLNFERM